MKKTKDKTSGAVKGKAKTGGTKGATRNSNRREVEQSRSKGSIKAFFIALLRLLKLVLLLGVVAAVGYFGREYWLYWTGKPVSNVVVQGDFNYVPRQQIEQEITAAIDAGFLALDLDAIGVELKHNPWVDRVAVQRRWPSTLVVTVVEHKPIARWNQDSVLNHRGEVIVLDSHNRMLNALQALPQLTGAGGMAEAVMDRYQALMQVFGAQGLTMTELHCDSTGSWKMTLSDKVVTVGRDRLMEKVEHFLLVYQKQLKGQWQRVDAIDLRYETGVAVSWLEGQQGGETKKKK
ncbi:MAG: cell division protein FtsQ/DivIB [Candidatus Pelagadaptatus aseana]|uniref:cell division protein FtsQ/DivIB n=1 Tax=Candidatus Pelagadaptatus aseana TaxID=3120508 RepID=UPI0039B3330C